MENKELLTVHVEARHERLVSTLNVIIYLLIKLKCISYV